MSVTGEIKNLYSNKDKTRVLLPRTKTKAVSDENGTSLDVLLDGKAPAGYGLGTWATDYGTAVADANDCTDSGWFYVTENTLNGPGTRGVMRVEGFNDLATTQTFYSAYYTTTMTMVLQRNKRNGVWEPWEFIQQPMYAGSEMRTTERFHGKPVYALYTGDLGGLSATSNFTAFNFKEHGIIDSIVSCTGNVWNDTNGIKWNFPFIYSDSANQFALCGASANGGIYVLSNSGALSSYNHCEFIVKYTKKAD